MSGTYRIEKCQYSLVGGIAGHNFWVLYDSNGNNIGEMHGIATDGKTGKQKTIGTKSTDILLDFNTHTDPSSTPKFQTASDLNDQTNVVENNFLIDDALCTAECPESVVSGTDIAHTSIGRIVTDEFRLGNFNSADYVLQ